MESQYNWKLILAVAVPIALIESFLLYSNILNFLKWLSLIISLAVAGAIVYLKDKKKGNIFTAVGVVFLIIILVKLLRNFGIV